MIYALIYGLIVFCYCPVIQFNLIIYSGQTVRNRWW